jgi:ATP-binding cassette, subfamily C, bacterial CydCD
LGRLEARAARAAGTAAGLAHLGWGVAVVGMAVVLSRVNGLTPEWAAVLLLGVVALGEPVAALPDAAVARQRAKAADNRLSELAAEPTGDSPANNSPANNSPANGGSGDDSPAEAGGWGDVVVRGLTAGWDPAKAPALRGIDLDLPVGARVAVVGPSGGGKSTLAAVLARLLRPRAGTVTIGGVDARALPEGLIRRKIALVSDDADHIFASTVRENLRLARPGADDRMLAAALRDVGLGGWDLGTLLGAGGSTVSGGQRRRFATARALLADPALLILDEPTEGLDQPAAEALMADLLDAAAGRTVLVLTHRTEGLDRVDRTLVLRDGRIGILTTAGA